jgi:uncharacterized protein
LLLASFEPGEARVEIFESVFVSASDIGETANVLGVDLELRRMLLNLSRHFVNGRVKRFCRLQQELQPSVDIAGLRIRITTHVFRVNQWRVALRYGYVRRCSLCRCWIIESGCFMQTSAVGDVSASSIAAICQKYRVRELALFGSVARGEADLDSDVDLYVEFEGDRHPGLQWFDLEEELETLFGRRVDLSRKSLLKPDVHQEAVRDAVVLYGG